MGITSKASTCPVHCSQPLQEAGTRNQGKTFLFSPLPYTPVICSLVSEHGKLMELCLRVNSGHREVEGLDREFGDGDEATTDRESGKVEPEPWPCADYWKIITPLGNQAPFTNAINEDNTKAEAT